MECVFGIVGRGFAVVTAYTSVVQSILVHKNDEDKIMVLDSHMVLGGSGKPGDRVQFTEFMQKNVHLYKFKNNMPLSTAATTNFTCGELATALHKVLFAVSAGPETGARQPRGEQRVQGQRFYVPFVLDLAGVAPNDFQKVHFPSS